MPERAPVRFRVRSDVWIGLGALVFAGLYWWVADDIPISPLDGVVNAAAVPKALAWAMATFSMLLIGRSMLVEMASVRAARRAAVPPPPVKGLRSAREHLRAVGVLVIGVVYLLVLPWLGYVCSIGLLIGGLSVYLGARPGAYTAAVAVAIAVAYYLLFVRLLGIPLPPGFWPSLV